MKTRFQLLCGLLFLAVSIPSGIAQDDTSSALDTMIAEYDKALAAFRERVSAAPAEKRREMYKKQPDAAPVIEKIQAFIKATPENGEVPEAAAWLLKQRSQGIDKAAAYTALTDHHLAHADLADTCMSVLYDSSDEGRTFAETVFKKADSAQARAAAAYVLASKLRRAEDEESKKKRIEYLHAVIKDIGDLEFRGRRIKASAEGTLFAAENLAIGKLAPEIEGVDTNGEVMKLSDFRGKVVVLDFWGDW